MKKAIAPLDRVLVISRHSHQWSVANLNSQLVFSEGLVVIAFSSYSGFLILQSRLHEIWVRFFGSSLEDRIRYTSSDCFETFPFPYPFNSPLEKDTDNLERNPREKEYLEEIGKIYYEYRAELMVRNNQGLTDTYNRFHDPYETDTEILRLRELHEEMDKVVLKAYGWDDIDTTCGFALDYLDIEDDTELPSEAQERITTGDYFFDTADEAMNFDSMVRTGKRKLPWRYRWSETTHDEVLARLLELNQQRAEEETLTGKKANKSQAKKKSSRKPKKKKTKVSDGQTELF